MAEGPSVVRLVQSESGWQLVRNGKSFYVKGAGARLGLKELAAAGGNSVRTWGVDDKTGEYLDECHRLGLTVTLGFWLRKAYDKFSYNDAAQVKEQFDYIQRYVRKYKDHPALLMWAVGNEMELGLPEDQVKPMWTHVNDVAKMMKQEDPGRPVISVVADMWPDKMKAILAHTTEIDALGVNSYGGLPSLEGRMKDWTKPYFITEFYHGAPTDGKGQPLELPAEPTSTEKAMELRRNYTNAILGLPGRVLGVYAFYWDRSGTQTSSWHNMHLKTGEKLQAVDELQWFWTGAYPANRSPEVVGSFRPDNSGRRWTVLARDPDRDRLTYTLEVISEDKPRFVGDFEQPMKAVFESRVAPTFSLPMALPEGRYRATILIRDGKGAAATWSTVYRVGP